MKSKAELRDKIRQLKKKLKKLEKSKLARERNTARADLVDMSESVDEWMKLAGDRETELNARVREIENLRYAVEVRNKNWVSRLEEVDNLRARIQTLEADATAFDSARRTIRQTEQELRDCKASLAVERGALRIAHQKQLTAEADEKRWREFAGAGGLDAAELAAFRAWCVREKPAAPTSFEQDQTIPPPTNHEGGFHLLMPGGRSTKLRRWADLPGFKLEIWKGSSFLDEVWISDTQVREVTAEARRQDKYRLTDVVEQLLEAETKIES